MITCRHLGCGRNLPVWLLGLGLVLAVGCGDIPGDADDTGSVVSVEWLTGVYDGQDSNTVDAVQGLCTTGEGGEVEAEPYFDHLARAEITNRPLPNTTEQTASPVYIKSYTITFRALADDGSFYGPLPDLDPYLEIKVQDSRGISPCQPGTECSSTEYTGLKYMDVEKRQEYLEKLCGPVPVGTTPFPQRCVWVTGSPFLVEGSYNARYTFYGENIFGEDLSFRGETNFTITNYDNCQ